MSIQCMCRGYYEEKNETVMVSDLRGGAIELPHLRLYRCNQCNAEIYPEKTIEIIQNCQDHQHDQYSQLI